MSEYQYYEFRAIDRPLTSEEMEDLRDLSSQAEITATSFTNTYHWGNLKGNPAAMMERYFDAFVYVANWGTHTLMLRIPRGLLDVETARVYCDEVVVSLIGGEAHVVLEFTSREEEGAWEDAEGETWMSSLVSIRDELMRGDMRALYIGWLASFPDRGWYDPENLDDEVEPPVPPGLAKRSAPLRALADFLRVDDDLLEVAAAGSTGEAVAAPSRADLGKWVKSLPAADKDAALVLFLSQEGDISLRADLLRRFREANAPGKKARQETAARRTVASLLIERDALSNERIRKESEQAARAKAHQEEERAEARSKYLDELAGREQQTWREIEAAIAMKRPSEYDRAVALLVDLRELAERSGRSEQTAKRTRELRERHSSKSSLQKRFDAKGFSR